jgi:hypothetical protein
MGMFSWDMKSHISHYGRKSIFHKIMQGRLLLTMVHNEKGGSP